VLAGDAAQRVRDLPIGDILVSQFDLLIGKRLGSLNALAATRPIVSYETKDTG